MGVWDRISNETGWTALLGDAELHVWAGGFHAFDIFAPHTAVARGMVRTRDAWVEKILAD